MGEEDEFWNLLLRGLFKIGCGLIWIYPVRISVLSVKDSDKPTTILLSKGFALDFGFKIVALVATGTVQYIRRGISPVQV